MSTVFKVSALSRCKSLVNLDGKMPITIYMNGRRTDANEDLTRAMELKYYLSATGPI